MYVSTVCSSQSILAMQYTKRDNYEHKTLPSPTLNIHVPGMPTLLV